MRFNRFVSSSILAAILILLLNSMLIQKGDKLIDVGIVVYSEGLKFGLAVSGRLLLLSMSLLVFFVSTQLRDFTAFLAAAKVPTNIIAIILLSAHFLEELPSRIIQIYSAQEARGIPVRAGILSRIKAFIMLLSPLVLSSLAESIERGTALELRGFRGKLPVTFLKEDRLSVVGYVFLITGCAGILWNILWK